jgi:hypothetical protein
MLLRCESLGPPMSQLGQGLSSSIGANRLNPCLLYLRFQACQWWSGRITLCANHGPEQLQQSASTEYAVIRSPRRREQVTWEGQ